MQIEVNQPLELPYTIGFCMSGDTVLMLHRNFPPNQHLWNGIGGRIEAGESPDEAIAREMMEEAEIDIEQAQSVKYVGIVTWTIVQDATNAHKGMYAYIVKVASESIKWRSKTTREGRLEWKVLDWVMDVENPQVVDNIPHFLPRMITAEKPVRYHCQYEAGQFGKLIELSLPEDL